MERKLPEIHQHGMVLVADVDHRVIYLKDRPLMGLGFADLYRSGEGYEFFYDKEDEVLLPEPTEDSIRFEVLQLVEIDPLAMARAYGLKDTRMLPANDSDLLSLNKAFQRRCLYDELPLITIDKTTFYADIKYGELIAVNDPAQRIALSKFEETFDKRLVGIWDHKLQSVPEQRSFGERPMPEHFSAVVLPSNLVMDPVGTARKMKFPDSQFTWLAPVRNDLSARLFPVSIIGYKKEAGQHEFVERRQVPGIKQKAENTRAKRKRIPRRA